MASFSKHDGVGDVVSSILLESRWFIEWAANEFEISKAAELVDLQRQLARRDLESRQNWHDERWRNMIAAQASQ